ncbi:hypothetical protein QR77_29255 [Streptomyces sp. 150FB]|nr:hypothetical protein QR77_29255 [Streptomyces sp. 150FB]
MAIIAFPDFGHVNPALHLGRQLAERGVRVTYILDEVNRPAVEAAGGALIGYPGNRLRLGGESSVGAGRMFEVMLGFQTHTVEVILPQVRAALDQDVPDLLIYDYESFVAGRTLARAWDCPTVLFAPAIASNEHYSVHAEAFADDMTEMKQGVEELFALLSRVEPDEEAAWSLMTPLYDEPTVVFLPREYQPEGDTFDDRFTFVGHCVPDTPPDSDWRPPETGARVALISLGTESNERAGFFRTCAEAFDDGGWHAVMTLGRGNTAHDIPVAPNLESHEWLPHAAVLPHASALVCHGGIGSIMEALYFGCPVVIVPHTPEHIVNGRRLVELGLGVVYNTDEMVPGTLRQVVDDLASDPVVQDRLDHMSAAIRGAGGAARAADMVEKILAG